MDEVVCVSKQVRKHVDIYFSGMFVERPLLVLYTLYCPLFIHFSVYFQGFPKVAASGYARK